MAGDEALRSGGIAVGQLASQSLHRVRQAGVRSGSSLIQFIVRLLLSQQPDAFGSIGGSFF